VVKRLIGSGCRLGGEWGRSKDGCIRWVDNVEGEGQFWGKCGASHCNQWELCDVVILCGEGWRRSCSLILGGGISCFDFCCFRAITLSLLHLVVTVNWQVLPLIFAVLLPKFNFKVE